eukprot:15469938-Alexandrium_andersonii.AAC.1
MRVYVVQVNDLPRPSGSLEPWLCLARQFASQWRMLVKRAAQNFLDAGPAAVGPLLAFRHRSTRQEGDPLPFRCHECGKQFLQARHLAAHAQLQHSIRSPMT